MTNLVESAKRQLADLVLGAYRRAADDGVLPMSDDITVSVEIPRDLRNGDYATSFALAAAKKLGKNPREIAAALSERISLDGSMFSGCEIAGPGFLNFKLREDWFCDVVRAVLHDGGDYGRVNDGEGRSVQVEFVSANPTGPMTIGNARGGVLGDTLSSVLDFAGWKVTREFYLNDAGNQVAKFGRSLNVRYLQLIHGEDFIEMPEDAYHGADITDLAAEFRAEYGDDAASLDEQERVDKLVAFALPRNIERMKRDLERYGIHYDVWFAESTLHASGYVAETIDIIKKNGHTYEQDGALWFKATDFGLEKDEVLVRSNGLYTYYAVDIAYHRNKFEKRKFDRVIDALGADHHGHTLRFKAGMEAIGVDASKLEFLLFQFVMLYREGELVKVSKRSGRALSLADLLDEVPRDAVRFLFNMQTTNSVIDFDLDLAIKQTNENPVYYVQYAHARICTLLATLDADGISPASPEALKPELLATPEERTLIRLLANFPEVIRASAREKEPSMINRFLIDLAGAFHSFYAACRIRGEEEHIASARYALVLAVRQLLRTGLKLLGVSAPEKM